MAGYTLAIIVSLVLRPGFPFLSQPASLAVHLQGKDLRPDPRSTRKLGPGLLIQPASQLQLPKSSASSLIPTAITYSDSPSTISKVL